MGGRQVIRALYQHRPRADLPGVPTDVDAKLVGVDVANGAHLLEVLQ